MGEANEDTEDGGIIHWYLHDAYGVLGGDTESPSHNVAPGMEPLDKCLIRHNVGGIVRWF